MVAVIGIYLSSYFRFNSTAALSVVVDDGWCNPKVQGIGSHCFGDFYYTLGFVSLPNPWAGSTFPYPPLATFLFKPFLFISTETPNTPWALLLYLFLLAAAITFVPYYISKIYRLNRRNSLLVFTFTISATPFLVALDRGNVIILTVPLLYMFLMAEIEGDNRKSFMFWVIMVLIKPQLSILGLLYFRNKQIKRGMINLLLGFIAFLASFILYPTNVVENIKSFFRQIISFQDYAEPGMLYPINVSLGNTLSLLSRLIFDSLPTSTILSLSSLILLFAVSLKSYFAPSDPTLQTITLIVLAVILFPLVSFGYYLILFIPVIQVIISLHFKESNMRRENESPNLSSEARNFLKNKWIRIFLLLCLLPIQIPLSLFVDVTSISTNLAISSHWILLQVGLVILTIYLLCFKRRVIN
jgi:hypothetical protein